MTTSPSSSRGCVATVTVVGGEQFVRRGARGTFGQAAQRAGSRFSCAPYIGPHRFETADVVERDNGPRSDFHLFSRRHWAAVGEM